MTIHRIHTDSRYPFFAISSEDIREKLGEDCVFHMSSAPVPYAGIWHAPVLLEFGPTEDTRIDQVPDLVVDDGRLFLNEKAYDLLRPVIEQDGEFLPVAYEGGTGYLFNPLKVAEEFEALEEGITTYNEYGEIQSLGFAEERLPAGTVLFRAKADAYFGLFCTDEFRKKVEDAGLVGVYFHPDLADIFGGGRGTDH